MRVVVLSGISRKAGGLFYAVKSLCQSLADYGVEMSVAGAADSYARIDLAEWNPVPASAFRAFGPLGYSPGLRRFISQKGSDVLHVHGIWMDGQWAALQWQKRTGRPVIVSPHGMLDPWALKNSAWKKRAVEKLFAREALERADCIHALCRSEVESIRAYGLKNPVALIPNGVELPRLEADRKSCGERRRLLFLGRIHPKKGLAELLQAWTRFDGDWELVIAGWDDGGFEAEIRRQAVGLSVSFAGPTYGEEKEALLRSADAFILPSFSEGLPVSVLEAWAHGVPALITDHCNLTEGFVAAAAIRIEPAADSILNGLKQLAALSDEELQRMGSNGRKLVEEKFAWPEIAANMKRVYDWFRTGRHPPDCLEL